MMSVPSWPLLLVSFQALVSISCCRIIFIDKGNMKNVNKTQSYLSITFIDFDSPLVAAFGKKIDPRLAALYVEKRLVVIVMFNFLCAASQVIYV